VLLQVTLTPKKPPAQAVLVYTELTLIAQYVFQIPTRLHCDIFTPRSAARARICSRARPRPGLQRPGMSASSSAACQDVPRATGI
jgi:hypothetical protein